MATELKYPRSEGYLWNFYQRIVNTIGVEPSSWERTETQIIVKFQVDLTPIQIAQVNAIAADNPCYPPTTTNTIYRIKDLWEYRNEIAVSMGLPFKIYYTETVQGSGLFDLIEIQFDKVLNNTEERKVENGYASSIEKP